MSVQSQLQFDDFGSQDKVDSVEATFLSSVANDLLAKYGNDLSRITVVFPNRRARLFFNDYLCQSSDTPVWAPAYAGMDELFKQNSKLKLADPLKLLTDLYYTYTEVYYRNQKDAAKETFDEFYYFGEILLSDFNDVDKNLVNEMALFSNLSELDQLKDDFEHLDEKQWEVIQRFFKDISNNRTQLKEAFYSIWNILGEVYSQFRTKLKNQGLAYDGMLFREVVDKLQAGDLETFTQQKYVFVGFNVLTECERMLFKILKQNGKALFYWDYDEYYMADAQEAGRFMRDNLRKFGNELKGLETRMLQGKPKKVTIVESSSENGQAAYVPQFLNEVNYKEEDTVPDTAIVLCNEQNLQAVMYAVPGTTAQGNQISANITMGYPLTQTPIFSLITALAELQLKGTDEKRFRYNFVLPVLRHPYVRLMFPDANAVQTEMVKQNNFFPTADELRFPLIFKACKDSLELSAYLVEIVKELAVKYGEQEAADDNFRQLYSEALFRAFQSLNRLHDLIQTGQLVVEKQTFVSLLKRMLSTTSVPFHGEPARGLQVMGVLETRNMDFRNVLMMSVNEGTMPKSENDSSFIPHFIRKFFGMTTIEHQDSLYAYYFYRLLQRAENVALIYNASNAQTGKMEKSRFLLQLLTESGWDIQRVNLKAEMHPHHPADLRVKKTPELLAKIKRQFDRNQNSEAQRLSPSAFNDYLDCSLRFYLQYIEHIRPPRELSDELDNSVLGSVFHKAVELIYLEMGRVKEEEGKPFPVFTVSEDMIDGFLHAPMRIERAIEEAFNEEFFGNRKVARKRYNGEQLVYFSVVKQFVNRLLRLDKATAPFTILGLEQRFYRDVQVDGMQIRVGGIVDRLDEAKGAVRVVDYKTGGQAKAVKSMDNLFVSHKDRANYVFQAFLYSSILTQKTEEPVVPALMYIHKATDEDYSPIITWDKQPIADFRDLASEFEEAFMEKLSEVFNPDVLFEQTTNEKACEWCNFKEMCGK